MTQVASVANFLAIGYWYSSDIYGLCHREVVSGGVFVAQRQTPLYNCVWCVVGVSDAEKAGQEKITTCGCDKLLGTETAGSLAVGVCH